MAGGSGDNSKIGNATGSATVAGEDGAIGGDRSVNASIPSRSSVIPEQLASTLDQIVCQLTIVTQTLGVFEERLTMHENRVSRIETMLQQSLNGKAQQ